MFPVLLALLRVNPGSARPRTTPDTVSGDKAYSAHAHRALLRSRGIKTVIPEPSDQSVTASDAVSEAGDRPRSTPTAAATSSSGPSTPSSNGEA